MVLKAMMNDKISELDATLLATHRDEWEPTQAFIIIIVCARSLRVCVVPMPRKQYKTPNNENMKLESSRWMQRAHICACNVNSYLAMRFIHDRNSTSAMKCTTQAANRSAINNSMDTWTPLPPLPLSTFMLNMQTHAALYN